MALTCVASPPSADSAPIHHGKGLSRRASASEMGSSRQELSWFFSRRLGLVLTLGLYQVYHINSEVYPYDLGTQSKLGMVF